MLCAQLTAAAKRPLDLYKKKPLLVATGKTFLASNCKSPACTVPCRFFFSKYKYCRELSKWERFSNLQMAKKNYVEWVCSVDLTSSVLQYEHAFVFFEFLSVYPERSVKAKKQTWVSKPPKNCPLQNLEMGLQCRSNWLSTTVRTCLWLAVFECLMTC